MRPPRRARPDRRARFVRTACIFEIMIFDLDATTQHAIGKLAARAPGPWRGRPALIYSDGADDPFTRYQAVIICVLHAGRPRVAAGVRRAVLAPIEES